MTEMSSLAQGLTLLDTLVRRERSGRSGLSASKLADLTQIERSRVSRLTQELLDLGMLTKSADGRLRVGPAYFTLAASRHDAWLRKSRRELRRLASSHPASLRIHAPDGPRSVLLRFEASPNAPQSAIHPGMVTPIWSTGSGRALLWDSSEPELAQLLMGGQFVGVGGPQAAKSVSEVANRVKADHHRGYVEAIDEFEYGVTEIAFPIRVQGQIAASISAACRSDDITTRRALIHEIVSVGNRIETWATTGPNDTTD